jgi:hypothetical protein
MGDAPRAALTTFTNPWAIAAALKVILYKVGAPVVAVYGRFAVVVPAQTVGLAPSVIVGRAFTVAENGTPALTQPVALFLTVRVPVYVAAAAAAGTVRTIGDAGSATLVTLANPAVMAAALHTILYWFGVPAVAV